MKILNRFISAVVVFLVSSTLIKAFVDDINPNRFRGFLEEKQDEHN